MGVYIHLPFCEHKCPYCDFYSIVVGEADGFSRLVDSYLVSLRREALYYKDRWGDRPIRSIFLGGGTPSLLPPEKLAALLSFLRQELPCAAELEITMEANPHSLTPEGAAILAEAGLNRVSLGAQAFADELLRAIGRLHRVEQIHQAVCSLRQAGIENINLDLMYGLPGQGLEQWQDTLEQALALQPTHFSCYALTLEPDTPLFRWHERGLVQLPGEDEQVEMYNLARDLLRQAGYEHYEISNWCLPGWNCRHNLLYWQNEPYLGLGSGAAGYVGGYRYLNAPDVQGYIRAWEDGTPLYAECERLSREQEMDETMMLGMRLLAGVEEERFRRRFQVSFREVYEQAIAELAAQSLVEEKDGHLRVTEQGLLLENRVSAAFLR